MSLIITDTSLITILAIYAATLLILIFSGMPIAFALGILGVGSLYIGFGPKLAPAIGHITWTCLTSIPMLCVPLFIFMGFVLFESGQSIRIYRGIAPLLTRLLPGGLLHSNIAVGALFAACSGSSLASCATIGAVALPEMESRGYETKIATGSVSAGATLGILIPPSIIMVVYGAMTETSIGKLFIAGIIPGLILTASYMTYIAIRVTLKPSLARMKEDTQQKPSWKSCLLGLLDIWPVILLILGVLGSIYLGVATPTEAAAIGCALSLISAAIRRLLSWEVLKRAVAGAVRISAMTLSIYLAANIMGIYLVNANIPGRLSMILTSMGIAPIAMFSMIFIMYLVMGMLMDALAMIIMTLPVTFPLMMTFGFDPIWFGIEVTMLVELAMLTPPVGLNLFILQGIRPEYRFSDIVRGCMPFFFVLLAVAWLLVVFPQLATFLPQTMMGK